jgi:hypothetical protein
MYVSALDEFEKKLEISLYPNPAQEQSTVRFQLEKAQDVRFDIFDLTGRSLWNQYTSYLEGGTNSMIIPMQDLKSGMYIIQLEIQGRRVQRRLLKE